MSSQQMSEQIHVFFFIFLTPMTNKECSLWQFKNPRLIHEQVERFKNDQVRIWLLFQFYDLFTTQI